MSDEDEKKEPSLPKTPEPEKFLETFSLSGPKKEIIPTKTPQ